MAVLFVWAYITDKTKNNQLHENNNAMLRLLTASVNTLTESNNNIAKSLEIISGNLITMDKKIDRNYEIELNKK